MGWDDFDPHVMERHSNGVGRGFGKVDTIAPFPIYFA
jgi:hypothetical protein